MPKISKPYRNTTAHKALQVFAWILTVLLAGCLAYLVYEMSRTQMFTGMQLVLAGIIAGVLLLLLGLGMIRIRRNLFWKALCMILAVAVGSCGLIGGRYLNMTSQALDFIGGGSTTPERDDSDILNEADLLTSKLAVTVTTYAMQSSGITKPSDIAGKVLGTAPALDEQGTTGALEQLRNNGASFETVEYGDIYSLTDALYNGSVDAIVFPEKYHGDLLEAANDYNAYNALTTFTNVADQYIYYEDIPEELKNPADPVADIQEDPFIVLVSGSDSYGTLNSKSRSDVNMLVAVNPKTYQVLIVSLPRDTYMPFSCRKNETACGYAAGQYDKLTHSGIYGIGTTETSIEDFLGIEINYTVRVNFSSLINVVDAIGGIDVTVDPGLEVERFYANGTEGVHEGVNHLNGERALAFARERHAYIDGDNQRIRNQQIVMKAIMKSMMSPSMIVNYPKFLRALSTAFSTNMPSDQIRSLIRLEISKFPAWDIQSYAMTGNPTTAFSAALGANASVSIVPEEQVEYAKTLFEEIRNGDPVDLSDAPASTSPDGTVPQQPDTEQGEDIQIPIPSTDWTPPAENPYPDYDYSQNWQQPSYDSNQNWQQPTEPAIPSEGSGENPGADEYPGGTETPVQPEPVVPDPVIPDPGTEASE